MELKNYSLALQDIQAASKEGLPDDLKAEVFSRMAICYKGMGEHNRAKISFALAERMLEGNTTQLNKIREYKATEYKEVKEIDRRGSNCLRMLIYLTAYLYVYCSSSKCKWITT